MYSFLRSALFGLDPERAHDLTLSGLDHAARLKLLPRLQRSPADPYHCLGIRFPSRVGLAAGLDKNGRCLHAWGHLGFGFVEVGTLTPRPQSGNPRPRVFRLVEANALINRMGFNNEGVLSVAARCRQAPPDLILGVNIGKNRDTPTSAALDDYRFCMDAVYDFAAYITINVSSPNTPGLRHLQLGEALDHLLGGLARHREQLSRRHGRQVPLLLKIAPDLQAQEISVLAQRVRHFGFDGIIATNTTLSREQVAGLPHAEEGGGLSGMPLAEQSRQVLSILRDTLGAEFPLISVGGISDGAEARRRIDSGASLVQLYTGLIYRGPGLVSEVIEAISEARNS